MKKVLKKASRKPKRAVKYLRVESQLQPASAIEAPVKLERVCRICESTAALQDLLLEEHTELASRFCSLTSIEIFPGHQWFCEVCLGRLNDAYDFIQQCKEVEEKRKGLLMAAKVKQEPDDDGLAEPMVDLPANEQIKVEELQIDDREVSGDSDSEPEPKESKLHTCETCQATFAKRTELFAHFKTHGKARFSCKLCDKAFARKCFLREHMISHKAEPSFFCEQCPNGYKTKTSLNCHIKTAHLGIKRFVCEECGKKFNQRAQLQQHAIVHAKEANVPCQSCDETFATGVLYREHMRNRHDAAGADQQLLPFECNVCNRVFPNRVCLTVHKHCHRERTVLCNVCGKAYRTVTQMKVHMKLSHVVEQLFECERCAKKFKTAKSLKFHQNGLCGR